MSFRGTAIQDERYLLLEAIGRGGMGSVYRAFDRLEQRLVALKVPCDAGGAGPAHPFSEEFDVWTRLDHPNIVRVWELARAASGPIPPRTPYLVLEHVRGEPVHRHHCPGHVPACSLRAIAEQLLLALDHLHARGFVHRDLKPANVLAQEVAGGPPVYRLTDFGLATPTGRACRRGTFSGSLPYVSPDALLGLPLDGRADLYSLGILLYYLATGRMPVTTSAPGEILRWHLAGAPADPSRVRPSVSGRLTRLIRRMTLRDRELRPPSARAALRLLGSPCAQRPSLDGSRRANRAALAELRLALDAVRLGASRVVRLSERQGARELLREVAVWSQVRGLGFHRLGEDPCGLVLRLVLERGRDAPELIRRHALDRALPLDLLGDLPLVDAVRRRDPAPGARLAAAAAARAIGGFLLRCAGNRPMVLHVERSVDDAPLLRELTRRLADAAARAAGPSSDGGGLLLLLEDAGAPAARCSARAAGD
jgi:serine/threonine-protein kinase